MRIGTDSASAFIRDVTHTNKFLAEQNQELIDLNERYMESLSSEILSPETEAQRKTEQNP